MARHKSKKTKNHSQNLPPEPQASEGNDAVVTTDVGIRKGDSSAKLIAVSEPKPSWFEHAIQESHSQNYVCASFDEDLGGTSKRKKKVVKKANSKPFSMEFNPESYKTWRESLEQKPDEETKKGTGEKNTMEFSTFQAEDGTNKHLTEYSINSKQYQELEAQIRARFPEEFKEFSKREVIDVLEELRKPKEPKNANDEIKDRSLGFSPELEADLHRRLDKMIDELNELKARGFYFGSSDDETDPNERDNKDQKNSQPEKGLDTNKLEGDSDAKIEIVKKDDENVAFSDEKKKNKKKIMVSKSESVPPALPKKDHTIAVHSLSLKNGKSALKKGAKNLVAELDNVYRILQSDGYNFSVSCDKNGQPVVHLPDKESESGSVFEGLTVSTKSDFLGQELNAMLAKYQKPGESDQNLEEKNNDKDSNAKIDIVKKDNENVAFSDKKKTNQKVLKSESDPPALPKKDYTIAVHSLSSKSRESALEKEAKNLVAELDNVYRILQSDGYDFSVSCDKNGQPTVHLPDKESESGSVFEGLTVSTKSDFLGQELKTMLAKYQKPGEIDQNLEERSKDKDSDAKIDIVKNDIENVTFSDKKKKNKKKIMNSKSESVPPALPEKDYTISVHSLSSKNGKSALEKNAKNLVAELDNVFKTMQTYGLNFSASWEKNDKPAVHLPEKESESGTVSEGLTASTKSDFLGQELEAMLAKYQKPGETDQNLEEKNNDKAESDKVAEVKRTQASKENGNEVKSTDEPKRENILSSSFFRKIKEVIQDPLRMDDARSQMENEISSELDKLFNDLQETAVANKIPGIEITVTESNLQLKNNKRKNKRAKNSISTPLRNNLTDKGYSGMSFFMTQLEQKIEKRSNREGNGDRNVQSSSSKQHEEDEKSIQNETPILSVESAGSSSKVHDPCDGPDTKSEMTVTLDKAKATLKIYQNSCRKDHSRGVEKFECSCHSMDVLLKRISGTNQ